MPLHFFVTNELFKLFADFIVGQRTGYHKTYSIFTQQFHGSYMLRAEAQHTSTGRDIFGYLVDTDSLVNDL